MPVGFNNDFAGTPAPVEPEEQRMMSSGSVPSVGIPRVVPAPMVPRSHVGDSRRLVTRASASSRLTVCVKRPIVTGAPASADGTPTSSEICI